MKLRSTLDGGFSLAALVAAGLVMFASGCNSCKPGGPPGKTQAYNLQINLGDSLRDSSMIVDLIAVNQNNVERMKNYSINKYWSPNDSVRKDLGKNEKISFSFVTGDKLHASLSATNELWKKWKLSGIQYLMVVADLPGVYDDGKTGSQDPRRQLLPICNCYWPPGTENLAVDVQQSGVSVGTAPRIGQTLPNGW